MIPETRHRPDAKSLELPILELARAADPWQARQSLQRPLYGGKETQLPFLIFVAEEGRCSSRSRCAPGFLRTARFMLSGGRVWSEPGASIAPNPWAPVRSGVESCYTYP